MLNRLLLQGRLVRDVELKTMQSGTVLAEFMVAWSEKIKENENKSFVRCKAWGNTATFIQNYFSKGQEIIIEGQTRTEEWEKDGQKQSRTICNVEKVHFCGSKQDNANNQPNTNTNTSQSSFIPVAVDVSNDDLPF